MGGLALALYGVYLALAVGVRLVLHRRRTGSSGFKGISGRPGSVEWIGGLLFVLGWALGIAGCLFDPISALDTTAVHVAGLVLYGAGLTGTLLAQEAMRASFRIGVDEAERTALVTDGPFALVRNPIYSAMLPALLGLALLAGSAVAFGGFVLVLVALELQTRLVEEPYLLRVHGREYSEYAARVGRFVPGIGRLVHGY
jgi:protein-S-isoprenylcysteine O-methyltransferase Ste14